MTDAGAALLRQFCKTADRNSDRKDSRHSLSNMTRRKRFLPCSSKGSLIPIGPDTSRILMRASAFRGRRDLASRGAPEMAFLYPQSEELPASAEQLREVDYGKHPAIEALNRICAELMILVGPMLWAALIVLFIWAEFFAK